MAVNELVPCVCGRVHIRTDVLFAGASIAVCDETPPDYLVLYNPSAPSAYRVPRPEVMW